jgi:hypothetical protein
MKVSIIAAVIAISVGTAFRASADTTYYLEDLDFSWMSSGWSTPCKNATIYNRSSPLRLWDGSAWTEYNRGISTQAESHWVINLGGQGVSFSATVGLDKSAFGDGDEMDGGRCGEHKVNFVVYDVIGGTNIVESGLMGTQSPAAMIAADLSGVELIDLAVYPEPGYYGGWQHCDWVNPTIVMKGDAAPVTRSADGTNHWTGKGADDFWATPANWEFGVPAAGATAVFDESVTVRIGQWDSRDEEYTGPALPEKVTVSNVVVNAGAVVTLRPVAPEYWDGPELIVQEINGAGRIQLAKVGIKANYVGDSTECTVNVAEIEMLPVTRWNSEIDSWLHGESNEGKFMVVNSTVKGTGRFYTYGNVTLKGDVAVSREFKMHSENASAKTVILDGGWVSAENLGEIEKLVFHSGTYDYADYSDKEWPLYLDGGTVNIGDGSSIGSDGLELGVLSGGYLRYTVSDIPETGVPGFPARLTFAADADLSNVFAIVKNTSGDAQKTYAITKTGDVYSFAVVVPTDTVKWIGGVDEHWETAGNWIYGAVPTEGQSVVFEQSAHIYIEKGTTVATVSTMTIADGATVRIETTDEWGWDNGPVIPFARITGAGTLALKHAQIRASAPAGESAVVDCARIEILAHANNDTGRSSVFIGPDNELPMIVESDISGQGCLKTYARVAFAGDNSGFTGYFIAPVTYNGFGNADRYFDTPESFFPNSSKFEFMGRIFANFTSGTAKLGNVNVGESYGATLVMKYGANVTLEVAGGKINDSHNGDGFEVWTRAEGADDYLRVTAVDPGTGYTKGCAGLTIKKVGEDTLVYGLTKAHNLVVAEGRVEFTGENNAGDDADVNVTVKAGASIGSSESLGCGWDNDTQSYKNGFVGGDVTVRHQFAFEPGGAIKQEYIATTTTDEQTQEETTTYSMRKLTIADDVDLANVVFGVTNPEALPAVTKELTRDRTQRFTMFAANSLSGTVATEDGGYAPDGSEKHGAWVARLSRSADNVVEFRPYVKSGFAVNIR